jgi:D-tyrosyl-tRNA(Tyr) deacylase
MPSVFGREAFYSYGARGQEILQERLQRVRKISKRLRKHWYFFGSLGVIGILGSIGIHYTSPMRLLLQKVSQASVSVDTKEIARISQGYLLFLGVMAGDTEEQAKWLAEKVSKLRLWDSSEGKINDRSLFDIGGSALVVSQFTLAGNTEKGNRPDYTAAAHPIVAEPLYERFCQFLREAGVGDVQNGKFGAAMQVDLTNEGPVTLVLER